MSDFIVKQIDVGGFDHNFSYLIVEQKSLESAIVDPCGDLQKIRAEINQIQNIKINYILLTHGHFDHVLGVAEIQREFAAKIAGHPKLPLKIDIPLADGDKINLGDSFTEVIHSPGHSDDSVVYRLSDDSAIFTGDTIFIDYIGYCKAKKMFETLQKIKKLSPSNIVFPGHNYGSTPHRSLGDEIKLNSFLAAENFEDFIHLLKSL